MKTKTHNAVESAIVSGNRRIRRAKRQLAKVATPVLIALVGGLILGSTTTLSVQWINHNVTFQSPVTKKILSPIPTHPVVIVTPTPTQAVKKGRNMSDREIRDYIYSKSWDKSIALRLAKSENGWNDGKKFDCAKIPQKKDGSIAYNPDGTYDVGIFQINNYWQRFNLREAGLTIEDMKDCKKNIDFAYRVYVDRNNSFSAWSAYENGSYLTHTDEIL